MNTSARQKYITYEKNEYHIEYNIENCFVWDVVKRYMTRERSGKLNIGMA